MWNKLVGIGIILFTALVLLGTLLLIYLMVVFMMEPKAGFPLASSPLGALLLFVYVAANVGLLVVVVAQILHAAKNPRFSESQMICWIILIWCLPFLTPMYWYNYMRSPPDDGDRLELDDD